MTTTQTATTGFGQIGAFTELFAEAKKLRQARYPAHVMVVEDDPLTQRVVVGTLGEANAMITEDTAGSAISSYLLHAPDIVFLDIGLPDADGFAVLDQILTIDPDAFVVMFSSHGDWQNIHKAQAAGAKGFVTKPFKKETLRNYIQDSAAHYRKS